jgi:hypothetical protein
MIISNIIEISRNSLASFVGFSGCKIAGPPNLFKNGLYAVFFVNTTAVQKEICRKITNGMTPPLSPSFYQYIAYTVILLKSMK